MKNDKYLLTGGQGFLGRAIREVLSTHDIKTLGRSSGNDYVVDLTKQVPAFTTAFDVVIHNAGKAHVVPRSAAERAAFTDVNILGTENLLAGLRASGKLPHAIVFISTVAVYGISQGMDITEDAPLSAADPYGKSKISAEEILQAWCASSNVSLAILRLPLVAGKTPPGNLEAMIRGIKKGYYVSIGNAQAKKSMVLAEDVAGIIPVAAENPGIYNLTDGYHPAFYELEYLVASQLKVKPPKRIPMWMAKIMGIGGDILDKIFPGKSPVTTDKIRKITSSLTFDDQKARQKLGWKPKQVLTAFQIR